MRKKSQNKACTIIDIAEALEVSAATVSRALNDHNDISLATKKRVRKMADQMGYQPNRIAAGLRQMKSNTIGIVVPMFTAIFHSSMITVIQNRLYEYGYHVLLCQSNDSYNLEKELVNTLYSFRVDAIVSAITLFTEDYSHFQPFVDRDIPVIFYDRVPTEDFPAHFVISDDFRGGYLAGQHLVEVGVKNPAFICGLMSSNLYQKRNAGFRKAMDQAGITLHDRHVYYQELTLENALETCRKLFDVPHPPDGIFTANDTTAIAVLKFAKERGINVPSDLKLIGYSNDPRSAIVEPAITTIDQNIPKMADKVVEKILTLLGVEDLIEIRPGLDQRELVDVSLVRRMST